MTWQDVADLSEYWADHPPLQAMVQAYLGIKPAHQTEPDVTYDNIPAIPNIPFKP